MSDTQDFVDNQEALVTAARFFDPAEAHMARSALEGAGIPVFLQGENANSLYPGAFSARLLVSRKDEARAAEILGPDATPDPDPDPDTDTTLQSPEDPAP